MGRYALGRYWERTDSSQQVEYRELFAAYVPNGYVNQLKTYTGAAISLVGSKPLNATDSVVTTKLAPHTGDAMVFDWRIRVRQDEHKVIDLVVGGVRLSASNSQRSSLGKASAAYSISCANMQLQRQQTAVMSSGILRANCAQRRPSIRRPNSF